MKTTIVLSVLAIVFAVPAVSLAANSIVPVPEPATGLLLLVSGAGVRRIASFAGHVSKATFGCFEPRRSADAGGAVFFGCVAITSCLACC